MYPFWEEIVEPLLKIVQPKCLIEIGCEAGKTTKRLLDFCEQHDAVLHGIDPSPRFDVDEWKTRSENRLIFHQTTSLQALPKIEDCDVVLIDGDHNWYTVYHELKLIEEKVVASGRLFPVVLLHDVGWPYGRRDLYYNPTTIPDENCHSFAKMGIHPSSGNLVGEGGFNSGLCNAVRENGPRNGVLTAVEDFQRQSKNPLELIVIPSFHGLGILFPLKLRDNIPELTQFLDSWKLSDDLQRSLTQLENVRVRLSVVEKNDALKAPTADRDQFLMRQVLGIIEQDDTSDGVKLARITRLLGKYRAEQIKNRVVSECGQVVQSGPFAEMRLLDRVAEGCYVPKLLGCYEQELHPLIESFGQADYECVLDIGCAEGYYAVGLARMLPDVDVYAHDRDEKAQSLCKQMAEMNDVSDRVHVGGLFPTQEFARFAGKRTLVICDIEGAELELLDPAAAPSLAKFDILVELHDLSGQHISEQLLPRFADSHDLEFIDHASRDHTRDSVLKGMSHLTN